MNKIQELKERIYKHCPELYRGVKHLKNFKNKCEPVHCFDPIHLEHVLRAIRDCMGIDFGFENGWFVQYLSMQTKKRIEYDLTKSFDQNCENTELVDFLLEVIN